MQGDLGAAEAELQAALGVARQQDAKWWELRVATTIGRMYHEHGQVNEALNLLAPVHNWFAKGFETNDLKEAKALLDELS